jgi:hypothetical protein
LRSREFLDADRNSSPKFDPVSICAAAQHTAVQWAEDGHMAGVEPPLTEDEQVIRSYREHGELVTRWQQSRNALTRLRNTLDLPDEELERRGEDRRDVERELDKREQQQRLAVVDVRQVRESLSRAEASLPPLPAPMIRQLDELEAAGL